MKIAIWGAGSVGKCALDVIGHKRVDLFIDNNPEIVEFNRKKVISYNSFLEFDEKDAYLIVVASGNHFHEIENKLQSDNLQRYFIFNMDLITQFAIYLPNYYLYKHFESVSYARILAKYDIAQYKGKKIAIYGGNCLLPFLILEIACQADYGAIDSICWEDGPDNVFGVRNVDEYTFFRNQYDVIVLNKQYGTLSRDEQRKMNQFVIIDLYDADCVEPLFYNESLVKYKNMYRGKRVFIICNGPSLTVEDLETLYKENEVCIGLNKIYKIYKKTRWRADFIGMYDQNVVEDAEDEGVFSKYDFLVGDSYHYEKPEKKNPLVNYFHVIKGYSDKEDAYPKFSNNMCQGFYEGYSVTYTFGLQFAVYLGAKEIILLGCDHSLGDDSAERGKHFISNYHDKDPDRYRQYAYPIEAVTRAYKAAKEYAERQGVNIYNATRGGYLEVFNRVKFDELFNNA